MDKTESAFYFQPPPDHTGEWKRPVSTARSRMNQPGTHRPLCSAQVSGDTVLREINRFNQTIPLQFGFTQNVF